MFPFPNMQCATSIAATVPFIGITQLVAGSGTVSLSLPTGTQSGDLIIVGSEYTSATAPTGFTKAGFMTIRSGVSQGANIFYKLVDDVDISNRSVSIPNPSGGWAWCVVYRGPTTATIKSTLSDINATSASLTGYTPTVGARAVLAVAGQFQFSSSGNADAMTLPAGFTKRSAMTYASGSSSVFNFNVADLPAISYSGSAVNWTSLTTDSTHVAGFLLMELV